LRADPRNHPISPLRNNNWSSLGWSPQEQPIHQNRAVLTALVPVEVGKRTLGTLGTLAIQCHERQVTHTKVQSSLKFGEKSKWRAQ
jgi:hypothetical protein